MSRIIRNYQIPDADLIQAGEVMSLKLPEDLAAFNAFDSTITNQYPDEIRQSLDTAKSYKSDTVLLKEIEELTRVMQHARDDCFSDFQTIGLFVRKAYKDDLPMQKKFGLGSLRKIKSSQSNFILFMESFAGIVAECRVNIVNAGCSEALINNLPGRVLALRNADSAQEKAKSNRMVITSKRVNALNNLYQKLKIIENAAQILFSGDMALRAKYTLPHPLPGTEKKGEGEVQPEGEAS